MVEEPVQFTPRAIRRRLIVLVITFGAFCAWLGMIDAAGQRGQTQPPPTQSPRATTPEERAHALLHDRGFENKSRIEGTLMIFVPIGRPGRDGPDFEEFLARQVCAADLVVQGTVESARSMLNASETFVFTDSVVRPEIVFWSKRSLKTESITVTRLGGEVELEGRRIAAGYSNEPGLLLGRRYILFLESLSAGWDYKDRPYLAQIEDQGRQVAFAPLGRWSPDAFFTQTFRFADVQAAIRVAAASCQGKDNR